MYAINPVATDTEVIFDLPPPFSLLWQPDAIYQRAIELCFLCYIRSTTQWLVDIEGVIYEHLEAEYAEEMAEGFDTVIVNAINAIVGQIHERHHAYTRALLDVLGYFNPVTYDYLSVTVSTSGPVLQLHLHAKDAF